MRFLAHDIRDSWRALTRAWRFTTLVSLTLALGIGINSAIFSVVDALLFKSLPYADADRLVRVAEWPATGANFTVAPAAFLAWRERVTSVQSLEARVAGDLALLEAAGPENVRGAAVTAGYFDLLGVPAARGRTFVARDAAPGEPCRVVVSHRLWRERLGADAARLDQPLRFAGEACTLIGILAADSVFDRAAFDVYRVLRFSAADRENQGRFLTVTGRLAAGVSLEQAQAELTGVATAFNATRGPAGRGWTASITPYRDVIVRTDTRRLVWVLAAAVAAVLLVACVNVAGLLLSRAIDRRRETAIRAALGASRWRLVRYHGVESLLLASFGGAAGLVVGQWALRMLVALVPPGTLPSEAIAAIDGRALVFTAGLTLLTALVFGTLPAWQGVGVTSSAALTSDGRTASASRRTTRLKSALLVLEVAMAMVLVTGASLLLVSFARLTAVDPGFQADRVLTWRMTLADSRVPPEAVAATFDRILDEVRLVPGVEHAAAVTSLPLGGWLFGTTFAVDGIPSDPDRPASAHIQHVTRDYFETLSIPLVAGRTFTRNDGRDAPRVAVVNETFARRFVTDGPAPGRRVKLGIETAQGESGAWWTIAGVVQDVKTGGLADRALATPEIYVPLEQSPMSSLFVAVKSTGSHPATLLPAIRAAVRAVDPDLPLNGVLTMDERLGVSVRVQRFRTAMISAFAALAGLLASLGVYAVRSQAVRSRAREIGVRLALGASRGQVLALVLGQSLRQVALGLALGIAGALLLARYVQPWLFETTTSDPFLMAGAAALLGAAALVASWIPAWRAATIDPLRMLREP